MSTPASTRAQRFVWCLFDFGNSAFPTVIITSVYALYFKRVVVAEAGGRGDELWGLATALGAFVVFLTAPLLGTLGDRLGRKRAFMATHAWACIAVTALLTMTGEGTIALAVVLVVAGVYCFEMANVFYNGFLPELVARDRVASLSGKGWAFGYAGGLLCLLLVLLLTKGLGVHERWLPLAVAAWYLVFTLPTILLLRDAPAPSGRRDSGGVWQKLGEIRRYPSLVRFLVAMFFYLNGLNTVYVFAAIFAQQSLGFTVTESIVLIMVLNVVASPGALLAARVAERCGAKQSIVWSLWLWLAAIAGGIVAASPELWSDPATRRVFFWGVAAVASLCIGATQATSRTFVGELAPPGMSGEFFGFMALSGRASAVLGPFVFGVLSHARGGDQRLALGSVAAFFAVGLVLLLRVPDPQPVSR